MLFAWCRKLRAEAGFPETSRAATFVPVTVTPDPAGFAGTSPSAVAGPGTIKISEQKNGHYSDHCFASMIASRTERKPLSMIVAAIGMSMTPARAIDLLSAPSSRKT